MFDLSHIPRVTDTLFVTQKEDKYLFLNTALPNWLVLNQNGAFIINLIDKKRSIKDIYGYLEKLKANISMDELLELFISLKKYGIIDDFDLKNQKKLIKKNQNNSSKLHIVHLKLTDECNLSCKYCYAESGAGGLFVPIKKDFFMIDFIKELRVKTFLITSSKLGCINDTLLSIEALKNKQIDFDFFINLYEDKDSFEEVSKPFLKDYFKELKFLQDYKI